MSALEARELARLVKLLGMLGSDQPGERAAAALKADQWVKAHGVSWQALLTPPKSPPAVRRPRAAPRKPVQPVRLAGWQDVAAELLARPGGLLRTADQAFVQSLLLRGYPGLTPKQTEWLRDLAERAGLSW